MFSMRDLLLCCDNLSIENLLTIVGNNGNILTKSVKDCLESLEIKNMKIRNFYIDSSGTSLIAVEEDL